MCFNHEFNKNVKFFKIQNRHFVTVVHGRKMASGLMRLRNMTNQYIKISIELYIYLKK